ncbi:hypothetical protein, partial [Vibrio splendidus]
MDNASTSYPKPNLVHERISFHTKYGCGSFNRSAFDVTDQANSIPDVTRGLLSDLIKCKPEEIY